MKLAAIDIGSNAVRLLVCRVHNTSQDIIVKKEELIRVPIRLGEDSFVTGKISDEKVQLLTDTMTAFKLLLNAFEVKAFRACATSAMRDAANTPEILKKIKTETGIEVELISGSTEANLIYENHIADHFTKDFSYLYIDVGGGSTELTLYSKNKPVFSKSFNIGTIRMLHNMVSKELWTEFKDFIKTKTEGFEPIIAIGSGGNINKIQRVLGKKGNRSLTYQNMTEFYDDIASLTYEQRMEKYGMKPDRADVIVPATRIFTTIMKHASIQRIVIPEIGLADGIIHQLFEEKYLTSNSAMKN